MDICLDIFILVHSRLYVYFKEFKLMISYYVTFIVGSIFGYFLACLMVMARGNTETHLDGLDYRIGQEDDGEY